MFCGYQIVVVQDPALLQIHKIDRLAVGSRPSPTRIDSVRCCVQITLAQVAWIVARIDGRRRRTAFQVSEFDVIESLQTANDILANLPVGNNHHEVTQQGS